MQCLTCSRFKIDALRQPYSGWLRMCQLVVLGCLCWQLVSGGLLCAEEAPQETIPAENGEADAAEFFVNTLGPFMAEHCVVCHSTDEPTGGIALDQAHDRQAVLENRELWDKVLLNLQQGTMPPADMPRPKFEQVETIVERVQAEISSYDCEGPADPGHVTIRRLNKAEYRNTIRDLLGVEFTPAADFPNDDVGYGFDNIGDVLTLSPMLLEKYLDAAQQVSELAIRTVDPHAPHDASVPLEKFTVAGSGRIHDIGLAFSSNGFAHYEYEFPHEAEYVFRIRAYGQQAGPEPARGMLKIGDQQIAEIEIPAQQDAPGEYEVRTTVAAGKQTVALGFVNDYWKPDHSDPSQRDRNLYFEALVINGPHGVPPAPLPETHLRLIPEEPDAGNYLRAARELIRSFAERAWRRPVTPIEANRVARLVEHAINEGDTFAEAMQLGVQAVLVSPSFLFRVESPAGEEDGVARLDDYQLATRLSYFLWSSMPDDELFALAAQRQLREPEVLRQQVLRMLADPRSDALVENFAAQWLQIRNLDTVQPDPEYFPGFDATLRDAMRTETKLFFAAVMREDRSIFDLLDADYTFLNDRLAEHYGIEGVQGTEFRRVSLPAGSARGGVLTQASVLTITSNPTRTSPVKRGKWVLEQMLGTPPPPAPPDVPELPEQESAEVGGTLRERFELHRADPSCASCHQRMDPIGFGLENFDGVGRWRETDGGDPVDPSGSLPSGDSFAGPADLKRILAGRKGEFRRNMAEKMLTFAIGRGLLRADRCVLDEIAEELAAGDDRFSVLVTSIVLSKPFLMQRTEGVEP